ncbi:MAG: heavy-metal-associated domain-containing protein [Clostridia bacterium]|nr:heavy-metal-associated domain-containing protein [Clostridia bacterium]
MKKAFDLEDLDCANCAAKMENGIREIKGVRDCSVSYMTQKMTLEADDDVFDDVLKKAVKLCRKIEPDCIIIVK